MRKVIAETVAPAFDLPWLVAKDEGLFDEEGVEVVLLPPNSRRDRTEARADIGATNWNRVSSVAGHGSSFEKREANLYFACECGNYRRVQEPAMIPEDEFQRTYTWMVSWGLIDPGHRIEDRVDLGVEARSHEAAVAKG